MSRRLFSVCLSTLVVLSVVPAAHAATRSVTPGGKDEGDCIAAACASLDYAYERSGDGDVVEVAAGEYGPQRVSLGAKPVTFRAEPGNKVRKLDNYASNVTFDGFDLDAKRTKTEGAVFENHAQPGGVNVTFKNGRIGNVVDEKGALLGGWTSVAPLNLVIENVEFHDVYNETVGVHNECILSESPGLTIRRSTFRNCATMDMMIARGDWWGQPPYGGVTLENNVFGHSTNDDGWHHYGVYFAIGAFQDIRAVNNTFENAVIFDVIGEGPYSGVWANNIGGGWTCLPGVTYRNNVGERCHQTDRRTAPATSCGPPNCVPARIAPAGWVDPANGDYRLIEASPARGVADPNYAPATDRDGKPRGARPDAGAYQHDEQLSAPRCTPLVLDDLPRNLTTVSTLLCAGIDLRYSITAAPQHGSATIDATGSISYTPVEGYIGTDRVLVRVADGSGGSAIGELELHIANHAPVCRPLDLGSLARGATVTELMDCTDPDGDKLDFTLSTPPAHGMATPSSNARLFYKAPDAYFGADDFAFAATDGVTTSAPTPVKVTVVNAVPHCQGATETIRNGKERSLALDCVDDDFDPLTFTITAQPAHGTAQLVSDDFSSTIVYTPAVGYVGADTISVRASDGLASSEPAIFVFDVTANHAPVCASRFEHIHAGLPASLRIACTDQDKQDSGALSFATGTAPGHGQLSGLPSGPSDEALVTYTPATGFIGADGFTVAVADGAATTMASVRLHVADTPFCEPLDPLELASGASAEIELRCTQPDDAEGPLTYEVVTAPQHGSLSGAGPVFTYKAAGTGGPDSFVVRAKGEAGSSPAVTQAITVPYAAPTCASQELTTAHDAVLDVALACADPSGAEPALEIVTPPPAGEGTVSAVDAARRVRFSAAAGFTGTTSFTFRARRGAVVSAPATVRIVVTRATPTPTPTPTATPDATATPTPVVLFPTATPTPTGTPLPGLAAKPSVSVSAAKQRLAAAAKGLRLTLASSLASDLTITVTVDKATAKRLKLGSTTLTKQVKRLSAGSTVLTLKFSSKVQRALARSSKPVKLKVALSGGQTLALTLSR